MNFKKDIAKRINELIKLPNGNDIVLKYERGLITLSETITLLKDNEKNINKKHDKYTYGMRIRGFSIGCQPMDGLIERKDSNDKRYYDIISYSRPLTDKEMKTFSLDLITDTIE